eukprot:5709328-Prymnesium_polylepis.1
MTCVQCVRVSIVRRPSTKQRAVARNAIPSVVRDAERALLRWGGGPCLAYSRRGAVLECGARPRATTLLVRTPRLQLSGDSQPTGPRATRA